MNIADKIMDLSFTQPSFRSVFLFVSHKELICSGGGISLFLESYSVHIHSKSTSKNIYLSVHASKNACPVFSQVFSYRVRLLTLYLTTEWQNWDLHTFRIKQIFHKNTYLTIPRYKASHTTLYSFQWLSFSFFVPRRIIKSPEHEVTHNNLPLWLISLFLSH